MRMRVVKPDYWKSPKLANLAGDWDAKLVLAAVWSYVEDNGVGLDNPALIGAECFPFEDHADAARRVEAALETLYLTGHVDRYKEEVGGTPLNLLGVVDWKEWQRPDKPSRARYPASDRVKGKRPARGSRVPRELPETDSPPGIGSGDRSSEIGDGDRTLEHFAEQSASMSGTAHARVNDERNRQLNALETQFPRQFSRKGKP